MRRGHLHEVRLDVHVLFNLLFEPLERRLGVGKRLVRLLKRREVQKVPLFVPVDERVHVRLRAVDRAGEQQDELHDLHVGRDLVVERPGADGVVVDAGDVFLVAVEIGLTPTLDRERRLQNLLRDAVHRDLDLVQVRVQHHARDLQLDLDLEERALEE